MKKIATTLTALVMATGLTMTAQAATKVTTTTTKTTTHHVKKATKANHGKKVSSVAKETNSKYTKAHGVSSVAKKDKKDVVTTKTGKKTGEVNMDIPAELKIDESNNKVAAPSAPATATPDTAPASVVVPVTKVTQTAPATQTTTVKPISKHQAIASTTTTVPVDVQTVPVVVTPKQ